MNDVTGCNSTFKNIESTHLGFRQVRQFLTQETKNSVKSLKKNLFENLEQFRQCQKVRQLVNYEDDRHFHAKVVLALRSACILLYHSHHNKNGIKYRFQQQGS